VRKRGYPRYTPTVDWVRMARRFPMRIALAGDGPEHPLRKDLRADVRIDTTADTSGD
jgi:multidrug resistance efflux pump